MNAAFVLGALVFALTGCAHRPNTTVQESTTAQGSGSRTIVQIGEIGFVSLGEGESTTVWVPITIADGLHVQANPASQEFLIPLELEFEPTAGLAFGRSVYPQAVRHRLEGDDEDLLTYEGRFNVGVPLRVVDTPADQAVTVVGKLRYQACDDTRCYFPRSVMVSFGVRIER